MFDNFKHGLPGINDPLPSIHTESESVNKFIVGKAETALRYKANQVFSTWENSSSTGVDRPKIVTATRTLLLS